METKGKEKTQETTEGNENVQTLGIYEFALALSHFPSESYSNQSP